MMKPKITVFSVTYYRLEFVKKWAYTFLSSLDTQDFDYEIFVVDNNSKDGTVDFLKQFFAENQKYKVNLVLRDSNVGFGAAFHEQFEKFTGDFFVHYASDIISDKGWTKVFHDKFVEDERLGMLAPFYEDNGNNPMVNAINYMRKANVDMKNRNIFYSFKDFPVNCADGFSMMRMKALKEIGGYKVKRIYGGHDACLSKQYHSKKWKVAYTSDWKVEHLRPTKDMLDYENWKKESQQNLRRIGVESGYNQEGGYYDK